MLHTLTLIVVPTNGFNAEARRILVEREKFVAKPGTLASPEANTKAVLGIDCADFHDVGVAIQLLSDKVEARMYLVDARRRVFRFRPMQNTLEPIGMTWEYGENQTVPELYHFFDFGGIRWAFSQPK